MLGVELDTSILVDVKDPNRTNAGTKRDKKSKESEDKSIIQCDPLFSTIIQLSLNKRDLTDYCQQFVKDYFAEGRPQRSCSKSPQRYSDGATGANSSKTSDAGSVTPPRTPNRNNTIINSSISIGVTSDIQANLPISPSPLSPTRKAANANANANSKANSPKPPKTAPRSNKKATLGVDSGVGEVEVDENRSKSRGRSIRF